MVNENERLMKINDFLLLLKAAFIYKYNIIIHNLYQNQKNLVETGK